MRRRERQAVTKDLTSDR